MIIALSLWAITILFSGILGTFLCYRIEKSKVKHWGASGKLFK